MVELPPPLPDKPTFMSRGDKKSSSDAQSPPPKLSPKKRGKPLPPRPDLNGHDTAEKPTRNQDFSDLQRNNTTQENGVDAPKDENVGPHYQSVDGEKSQPVNDEYQTIGGDKLESENDPSKVGTNGSHYQSVDDQKMESEYTEPRARLDTRSSNPDLTKIPGGKGKLDPSKRNTLHRSAPSLAHYSTVNKKSKGSPKLTKSSSTFKLFKRIGRSSKKEEETYEKVPKKNKKSPKKENKTASLKPLITEEDAASYVDIDGEESALARSLMDRRDSKRPLPDLPRGSSIDV